MTAEACCILYLACRKHLMNTLWHQLTVLILTHFSKIERNMRRCIGNP